MKNSCALKRFCLRNTNSTFSIVQNVAAQTNLSGAEHDSRGESNSAINKQLESLLNAKSPNHQAERAEVTLLGHLVGPGPKRFGHLDQFRMKFVITRVEAAKPVPPKTAWPSIESEDTSGIE